MRLNYHELVEIIDMAGFSPRSYSGRGMFGRQCVGVVLEDTHDALAALIEVCSSTDQAADLLRQSRSDGMGRQIIIYWPKVEWREGVETE